MWNIKLVTCTYLLIAIGAISTAPSTTVPTPTKPPIELVSVSQTIPSQSDDGTPSPPVAENTSPSKNETTKLPKPELYSMKVNSKINSRYATTVVSSRVANPANVAQEVTFAIVIPETAFISDFNMELEGKVYHAYVKEKEEAKKDYDQAVQSGISAGHVAVSARDSNRFTVSVNVEPLSKGIFNLTYEELLERRHDVYNIVLNLHPGQLVRDLSVEVEIDEINKITELRTPNLRTGNEIDADASAIKNPFASIQYKNDQHTSAVVKFAPTIEQQKELIKDLEKKVTKNEPFDTNANRETNNEDDDGIAGQFVVQYDVERDPQGGEVVVYDGYFVHFFAPKTLKPLNKHVVFVLDVSGSMYGTKIAQLKEAMHVILDDLQPGDYFNLIEFSYDAQVYNLDSPQTSGDQPEFVRKNEDSIKIYPPYPVNKKYIGVAKEVINKLDASGGTNINAALTLALRLVNGFSNAPLERPVDEVSGKPNAVLPTDPVAMESSIDRIDGKEEEASKPTSTASPSSSSTTVPSSTTTASIKPSQLPEPIIVFLTDGDATVGEMNQKKILNTVSELNSGPKSAAIFSLAFGDDADRGFLKQVALRNHGFLRHIYEAGDAANQLHDFYKTIASPLLANVVFKYPADQIEEATDRDFHILFSGTELVVAGKLIDPKLVPILRVSGTTLEGPIDYIPKIVPNAFSEKSKPNLKRLWAYLTIKQLLEKKDAFIDSKQGAVLETGTTSIPVEKPESRALELALKYSFVTPLTSLVVVKPNSTAAVDTEDASSGGAPYYPAIGGALPLAHQFLSIPAPQSFVNYAVASASGSRPYMVSSNNMMQFGAYGPPGPPPALYMPSNIPVLASHDRMDYDIGYESAVTFKTTTRKPPQFYNTLKTNGLETLQWLISYMQYDTKVVIPESKYAKVPKILNRIDGDNIYPVCDSHSANATQNCVPLANCASLHPLLVGVDEFLLYECDLGNSFSEYLGVCCKTDDATTEAVDLTTVTTEATTMAQP